MPIVWRPAMAIGDPGIDADHQKLIEIINSIEAVLASEQAHAELAQKFDQLSAYVKEHFEREENLMRHTGYNGLIHHRQAHRELREQLVGIRAGIEATQADAITPEEVERVVQLLRHWLIDHVLKEDMLLRDFLVKNG